MYVTSDGQEFVIEVETYLGNGEVLGWGQDEGFKNVSKGLAVIKLDSGRIVNFSAQSIKPLKTNLVLA